MEETWSHGIYLYSCYRLGHMVLTFTDGTVLILLNHTCTRGPSVYHMQEFGGLNSFLASELNLS